MPRVAIIMENLAEPSRESQVSITDLAIIAGSEKWTLFGVAILIPVAALLVSMSVPDTYTARTLLLPPQQGQTAASSALATFGVLSASLGSAAGVKSSEEIYVAFLRSDSISDSLIAKFQLMERYRRTTVIDTRMELAGRTKIVAERKSGMVTVEVDDTDPIFAAALANGFSEELRLLMNRIAVTEASVRRKYFEEQASFAKATLAAAEVAYKAAQEKYGIQSIDIKAQGDLKASSDLRAQIMLREIQAQAMRSYAALENSDLKRLMTEISSMRAQLTKVEQGGGIDGLTSEEALANQRAYREVKYQEAVLSGLITQAELARADEARQAPLVQQVDVAKAPDKKSRPQRRLVVIISMSIGLVLGIVLAFGRHYLRIRSGRPGSAARRQALRDAWRFRAPWSNE